MKSSILILSLMAAVQSFGFTANDFAGRFKLHSEIVNGDSFCFQEIIISIQGKNLEFYRTDMSDYPLYKAEINGEKRSVKGSHGEAFSTSKGSDQVTFAKSKLVVQYKGTESFIGLPSSKDSDTLTMSFAKNMDTMNMTREMKELSILGSKKGLATCEYIRQ
jgi:hypothetical protein